jgi:dTMP kinase
MSLFITFEGPEGSGKSTQARLLYERLHARGYPIILTREPGGTRISDLIRRIVLDLQHTEMAPPTETLLFSAARAQLVNQVIRPYLDQGGVVLCDRYADSTYAHQGYGLGRDLDELRTITAIATGGLLPDLTIYLDLSAEEGLERKQLKARGKSLAEQSNQSLSRISDTAQRPAIVEWNRLDARDLAYHQRVVAGYRALIAQEPERWRSFDARLAAETLAEQIAQTVEPWLEHIRMLEPMP